MFAELGSILTVFTPSFLLVMLAGVFGGLVIGAMPGLTSTMAVALLVPITYGMSMELGIAMLVAVYIGAISGGLVAAALLNIPGTPSSVATTFDAYPMVQRGEAGRALAIGVFASFAGGFFSFLVMVTVSPLLGRFALRFASYEYFALVIFTLTTIISLSRASLIKGVISACMGLLMACAGLSDIDTAVRFTFGIEDLQTGFNALPVLIGMYAISQIMEEIRTINEPYKLTYASFTWKEFWHVIKTDFGPRENLYNFFRSSLIGTGIGILPGVGPGLSNILAYTQAKQSSKDPESFGKGNPNGIIASESANNASTGGAMIPLLTLGIPGDSTTLMMLGAFMIHGIQPGPLLFRDSGSLVALIFAAYFVSNCFMLLLQVQFIRVLIKSLSAPRHILYPVIMALCVIGSFSLNSNMFDAWVFFYMGIVGFFMVMCKFPLLPLVLGLLLGGMMEREFRTSWVHGGDSLAGFLDRPIALGFLFVAALSLSWSLYQHYKANKKGEALQAAAEQ